MDINTLLDPTHLLAFVGGTAVGAAGKYYADKFTDQRKKKEAAQEKLLIFKKARSSMPDLFAEMRADLEREKAKHLRELVVLPNEAVIFNSDRERFAYFETQHPGLHAKLAHLAGLGYLSQLREGDAPIYRFNESFVEQLESDA